LTDRNYLSPNRSIVLLQKIRQNQELIDPVTEHRRSLRDQRQAKTNG